MRERARKALLRPLQLLGAGRLTGRLLASRLFLIGYHSISPEKRSSWHHTFAHLSIDQARFADQIALLASEGHSFVRMGEIEDPLPPKPTVIFFDDGFRDVLTEALPILQAHRAPATLFVSTGLVDRTEVLWSMKARHRGMTEREVRALKKRPAQEREEAVAGVSMPELDVFLDWKDIRSLAQSGFEIGAHAVSHRPLTECTPEELDGEIRTSADRIERELGARPRSFSYPHGRYDGRIVDGVRRAGFRVAVGGRTGLNPLDSIEGRRLFLRRIAPAPGDSISDFAARLYLEGALR